MFLIVCHGVAALAQVRSTGGRLLYDNSVAKWKLIPMRF